MKKAAALLLCAAMLLLCACGAKEEPAPVDSGVTLRVVTSYGAEDGNRKHFEAAVADYEAATGNRIIDNSDTSNEEWKARIITDFETGSEPDVLFFFANADAEPFIQANKVVSVEEIRESYPDYAGNMDGSKLPRASNGQCYAVPITGYWEYLYVNRALLNKCGIPMPDANYSWDAFVNDCRTIREKGYIPIACSLAEVSHYWFEFTVMNNGTIENHLAVPELDSDGTLVDNEVSAKWIAGLEDIRTLYEMGFFPANTLTVGDAETVAMFGDGDAAFLLDGSWKVGYFTENYPDKLENFALCNVPAKGQRRAGETIGGISTGFFITRKAWNDPGKRDAAVAFVSHMTSDNVIRSFVTAENTALKNPVTPQSRNSLHTEAAQAVARSTRMVGAVQDMISGEARSSLFANIRNVVTGEMSAHDAVQISMMFN